MKRVVLALLAIVAGASVAAANGDTRPDRRSPRPGSSQGAAIQPVPYSAMLMRHVCHPVPGHRGPWHVVLRSCPSCVPHPVHGLKHCVCIDKGTQLIPDRCGWAHGPYGYNICVDYWLEARLLHTWWHLSPEKGAVPSQGIALLPTPVAPPPVHHAPRPEYRPDPVRVPKREVRESSREHHRVHRPHRSDDSGTWKHGSRACWADGNLKMKSPGYTGTCPK